MMQPQAQEDNSNLFRQCPKAQRQSLPQHMKSVLNLSPHHLRVSEKNALLYLRLREQGCHKKPSIVFCCRQHCRYDLNRQRDGPAENRCLIPARHNDSQIVYRGWEVSNNIEFDVPQQYRSSTEEMSKESLQQQQLQEKLSAHAMKKYNKQVQSFQTQQAEMDRRFALSSIPSLVMRVQKTHEIQQNVKERDQQRFADCESSGMRFYELPDSLNEAQISMQKSSLIHALHASTDIDLTFVGKIQEGPKSLTKQDSILSQSLLEKASKMQTAENQYLGVSTKTILPTNYTSSATGATALSVSSQTEGATTGKNQSFSNLPILDFHQTNQNLTPSSSNFAKMVESSVISNKKKLNKSESSTAKNYQAKSFFALKAGNSLPIPAKYQVIRHSGSSKDLKQNESRFAQKISSQSQQNNYDLEEKKTCDEIDNQPEESKVIDEDEIVQKYKDEVDKAITQMRNVMHPSRHVYMEKCLREQNQKQLRDELEIKRQQRRHKLFQKYAKSVNYETLSTLMHNHLIEFAQFNRDLNNWVHNVATQKNVRKPISPVQDGNLKTMKALIDSQRTKLLLRMQKVPPNQAKFIKERQVNALNHKRTAFQQQQEAKSQFLSANMTFTQQNDDLQPTQI